MASMSSPVRRVGGFPLSAMALAAAIWGFSGRAAMAQGGGNDAYGAPAYGVAGGPAGPYGAYSGGAGCTGVDYGPSGIFGPGYPGFGLEYCSRDACHSIHRHLREGSLGNWVADVSGRECLDPYLADPYSDPKAALGFWPPYSAPVASVPTQAVRGSDLGIDEEPVDDSVGARGMRVAKVYSGTAAAKASLQAGDVLYSVNGYSTQQHGNLAWIIANAASNHVLEIRLHSARDGQERTITARIN
jgi:hypothetical protein